MHNHETNSGMHWTEEETSPPLDQKQPSTPASSWRGWSLWLRVLGVVVAFAGGFASFLPIDVPIYMILMARPILFGMVSGGLLRSWWAMLIVPVAFSLGLFVLIVAMGGFDLQKMIESGFEGLDLDIPILGVVSVAIGAAIGTPIGKKIEQRLQH
jgi:hypothetical protein